MVNLVWSGCGFCHSAQSSPVDTLLATGQAAPVAYNSLLRQLSISHKLPLVMLTSGLLISLWSAAHPGTNAARAVLLGQLL